MAQELWSFQATITAGSTVFAPTRVATKMPPRQVDRLEIVVPPGPSGVMGFAVTMSGVNVIPVQPGTFMITDNERIAWDLSNLPNSGDWQVTGFNGGVFDHTIYLRWLVEVVPTRSASSPLTNISLDLLSST